MVAGRSYMERMRCVGGGDTPLGFRGVVEEELEEEVAAVSASGRPMQRQRRRRRRWGEDADDGYSASSTGGGGSSGCGSFGCDSVRLAPCIASTTFFVDFL